VAPVAGPLRDDDFARPLAAAEFDDGGDHPRVGVDHLVTVILDQVRLQNDALAGEWDLGPELCELPAEDVDQISVVVADGRDVDLRRRGRLSESVEPANDHAAEGGADA